MKYSKFIGRIGALAVALGVGSAIGLPAGVAWADPETTADASSSAGAEGAAGAAEPEAGSPDSDSTGASDAPDSGSTGATTATTTSGTADPASGSAVSVQVAPGVTISHSGGVDSSTHSTVQDPDVIDATDDVDPEPEPAQDTPAPTTADSKNSEATGTDSSAPTPPKSVTSAQAVTGSISAEPSAGESTSTAGDGSSASATAATTTSALTLSVTAPPSTPPPTIQAAVSSVLRSLFSPILSVLFAAAQQGGAASPLAWMFAAAARRDLDPAAAPTTDTTARLATLQAVAAANEPPTVGATFTTPDPKTGAVTGKLVGTDPEGTKVTISLAAKPTTGTFTYNSTTATFTYTPTMSQRILAGATPGADTIAMTVTASDGVNKVPVQIDIPIGAIPIAVRTDVTGVAGGAVAATNTRLYVTNRTAGTVAVVDTITGTVIGTYAAGIAPDGIAVKKDGTRLYVSSSTGNTVTVLDAATGVVKATIAVSSPTSVTMSPSDGVVYATSYATATVTRISTSTNRVNATIKLPAGSRPTGLAVSPDTNRIYVASTTAAGTSSVLVFSSTSTVATTLAQLSSAPTSLTVTPNNAKLYAATADGSVTVFDTRTRAVVGTIAVGGAATAMTVSKDGTALVVTDAGGRVQVFDAVRGGLLDDLSTRATPGGQTAAAVTSPDGTEVYVTDATAGVVHVVALTPPNARPTVGTPTLGTPNATTGAVTGSVGVTDSDGDPLSYSVSGAPTKGKVVVNANGTFTYTPTAAARHAAAADDASKTDTFTVTVSDGRRGVVTATIQVTISTTNRVPTVTTTVGTPSTTTGVVTGSVKGTDGDYDRLEYSIATGPTKGTVTLTATGGFTYTPTATARHAAARIGATTTDKQDTFTVTVDDGHGGSVTATVTVKISPANAKPNGASGSVTGTDPQTGTVTGALTAVDTDADALTYTAVAPTKGALVIGANGTFTYTPTTAARVAASAPNATAAAKAETITFSVADGYGGVASFTLSVPITPYSAGNQAPTDARGTVTNSSSAIGTVTGTVTAFDPNGDPLTYTVTGGPTKGVLKFNAATGAFSYTPNVDARYTALVTPGVDVDTFTVSITDGRGGLTTTTVTVTVVPPTANQVDQRATSVAVHAPDLLFYSQAQLNTAFDALQGTGIDTVRIMIPWAAIEPLPGWYDWSAIDRVVNTAAARNIKVLGVLNSTPLWAAVPDTLPLAGMPKDNAQFANFARIVATRYKGKVASYEVWNEPNGIQFWQPSPNAAQYTELLKAAYTAIKTADPNAVVVAAAVGAVIDFGILTVNPVRFISEMYAAGAAGYFDALSFHPYLYNNPFSQGTPYYDSPLNQAKRIYNLMVANGDGNKKLWNTEYGQPASVVSEANQAAYLGDFLRTWRDLPFAGPSFIHSLVDNAGADPVEASFGLFYTDWTAKPSLTTVKQVIVENDAIEAAKYGL